jgi:hypothetical protein
MRYSKAQSKKKSERRKNPVDFLMFGNHHRILTLYAEESKASTKEKKVKP